MSTQVAPATEAGNASRVPLQEHLESHQSERAPGEGPRSLSEAWQEFKGRVTVEDKTRAPREQDHVDLANKTEEVSEQRGKESQADKGAKSAAEGDAANIHDIAKAATTETQQSSSDFDRILERAAKEPEFDKVVERLQEPFFALSREGHARFQVLSYALNEVINPQDVVYYLARPENSSAVLKLQDAQPHEIAKAVHVISAKLRFGGSVSKPAEEERRPRAPKPPSEVGGRGTALDGEDAAIRRNDFKTAEAIWNRRLKKAAE